MLKKYLFGILYTLFLCTFTVYIVLDTFVITKVYQIVPPASSFGTGDTGSANAGMSGSDRPAETDGMHQITINTDPVEETNGAIEETTSPPINQVIQTDTSYSDGRISITITEYRVHNTTVYVADVVLSSPEYLKTAFANNAYGRNVTAKTSETAKQNGALLAINGDYYGARERGYVLRNGVAYRDSGSSGTEALVIYDTGEFEIVTEKQVSLDELEKNGARQVLSFGPALIIDFQNAVSEGEEVGQAMRSNPRTAIGIVDQLHYLFVVSDGRTSQSEGLSLHELADFMQSLGAATAYNLDGGGSSTMYFNGKIINQPTTDGKTIKERSVSDIVYIGY